MKLGLAPLNEEFIPYGRHFVDDDDHAAIIEALRSSNLTQGAAVSFFEDELKKITGAKYAVAVTNGTAALHIAVAALDLPHGSLGVTTSISFAASSNCMLYNGLRAGFTDIEPETGLMSMDDLEKQLEKARRQGDPVRLVIPVHYAGQPCDMVRLSALKDKYGFKIIEDAAHALGASYSDGRTVGSLENSEFTTLSFHPVKHIATGEGGAILTNDRALYEKIRILRSHGILKEPDKYTNHEQAYDPSTKQPYPWYYEMQMLGFNYRMPDMNAALGVSQARKFPTFIQRRRQIAEIYDYAFESNSAFETLRSQKYGNSAYHLYVILLNSNRALQDKARIYEALMTKKIGSQVHYIPIPMLPYYQRLGYSAPNNARLFYERALSIPMYPSMTDTQVEYVIRSLQAVTELNPSRS